MLIINKTFFPAVLKIIIIFFFIWIYSTGISLARDNDIQTLSEYLNSNPEKIKPQSQMYSEDDIIFCTGKDSAGMENNKAAEFMKKGDFISAFEILHNALKHSPLFFPFRYNIGICYIHLDNPAMAEFHLEKAADIFPEYYKTYIKLGYIFERKNKSDIAISYYRKAAKLNPRANEVYAAIGDIYLQRNQLTTAEKYYNESIEIDSKSPDAHLGIAKIYYLKKNFLKSLIIIKSIDTSDNNYDKSLHYYYAECAYKLQDYKTARDQYDLLLQFRNDKFFLTTSTALIKHKIGLCERFIELKPE
ncbi:MAG: tetratricopeptide repeat protein [Spirochaetes bacterium]|nr:tetratricopeptide repeat protein [Spirochaetota bacterium]